MQAYERYEYQYGTVSCIEPTSTSTSTSSDYQGFYTSQQAASSAMKSSATLPKAIKVMGHIVTNSAPDIRSLGLPRAMSITECLPGNTLWLALRVFASKLQALEHAQLVIAERLKAA
eukprot:scaffold312998_cov25-Prasinocladus_malaysianus.AAC.1